MFKKIFNVIVSVVMVVIFFGIMHGMRRIIFSDWDQPLMASTLSQIVAAILTGAMVYVLHRNRLTPQIRINTSQIYPKFVFRAMYFKVSFVCMVQGILFILFAFTGYETLITGNTARFSDAVFCENILIFISVVIAAPLIEEVLFRGLLFGALKDLMGLPGAIILSGVIFGALHGTSVGTVVGTATAGIALAYIYAMSKNLINSIIAHSAFNLIAVCRVFIQGEPEIIEGITASSTWLLIIISLTMIAFCFGLSVLFIKGMKRELRRHRIIKIVGVSISEF